MPQEIFSAPMIGAGTLTDPFRVRYVRDEFGGAFGLPLADGSIRYSRTSTAILALDAPQTYLDQVAAQPDAERFCAVPQLLDNVGGQGNNLIRNTMEPLGIPADWSAAANSWRQSIRTICGIFLFAQRHEGLNPGSPGFFDDLTASGGGLNTQWQNLTAPLQATILDNVASYGWTFNPEPTQQVRSILKFFADQFEGITFSLNIVEI